MCVITLRDATKSTWGEQHVVECYYDIYYITEQSCNIMSGQTLNSLRLLISSLKS